jgi:hypothetical protein
MKAGRLVTASQLCRRPARLGAAVAVALAVTAGAAGCSSPGDSGEESLPTASAEELNVDVSVLPGTDTAAEGARTDVTDEACEDRNGTWVTSGKVTNSSDGRRSYRIYTGFVDSTGETRAVVETGVKDLKAGESRRWEDSAPLGGLDGVRCVLRVERVAPSP